MSLTIHYGSSGAGKTYNLIENTLRLANENRNTNYLVVVPEQFTLSTQQSFISRSERKGIMNIDVLSFTRLASHIFDEAGGNKLEVLEDTGKSMIVKKVMMENRSRLSVYGGSVTRQGFVDEVKSVIAEFCQYSIESSDIDRMIELADKKPLMRGKLRDIKVVYEGFKDFLRDRFITNEELLDKASVLAEQSSIIENAVVCFDGFTGFTPSQYKLLQVLLKRAAEVHVTLTMPESLSGKELNEHNMFFLSYETSLKLRKLCAELGVQETTEVIKGVPRRFAEAPALAHLEQNLFRTSRTYKGEQDNVKLLRCRDRKDEVRTTICEIKSLLRRGYKGNEIAIVSGDAEAYGTLFAESFDKLGIPYFADHKENILGTPLVELVRSGIETANTDYSYESVFRFLKCGIGIMTPEEVDELENYCVALGIRGKSKWNSNWERQYRTRRATDLDRINVLRARTFEYLSPLTEVLQDKKTNVRERMTAIYTFADTVCKAGYKGDADELADRTFTQTSMILAGILDRLEKLLGDEVLSAEEFSSIIDTGFKEAKLRPLPPHPESIIIGDIERTRLDGIKILFFLGVNDAVVPKRSSTGGVLSDADREFLADNDFELAPTSRRQSYLSEFYLYLNMTKPSDRLYLSYVGIDEKGQAALASYVVGKVSSLFEQIEILDPDAIRARDEEGAFDVILGEDRGLTSLMNAIREGAQSEKAAFSTIYRLFAEEKDTRLNKVVKALTRNLAGECIDEEHARRLYGSVLVGSISRLEEYAKCAFAHFMGYGLKLEERTKYEMASRDIGTLYHKAIEVFSRDIKEDGLSWRVLTEELKSDYVERSVTEAAEDFGVLKSSGSYAYMLVQLKRVVRRTIDTVEAQVKAGYMEPSYFEESFNHSGKYMELRGKIDRMDVSEKNGKLYLRVVDYKSGSKSFDLLQLYHGLSLQLGVYLSEGAELIKKDKKGMEVVPAGMYYYRIDDPFVEEDENPEEEIAKQLRLDGLTNRSSTAIGLQDINLVSEIGEFLPEKKSTVIDAETSKEGVLKDKSNLADEESITALTRYLEESMRNSSESIMKGDTKAYPYKLKGKTGCDYCSYKTICGFTEKDSYRELEEMKSAEIWQTINNGRNGE